MPSGARPTEEFAEIFSQAEPLVRSIAPWWRWYDRLHRGVTAALQLVANSQHHQQQIGGAGSTTSTVVVVAAPAPAPSGSGSRARAAADALRRTVPVHGA
jgi:hypothetical protein